jgi:hypothetical protein
MVSPTKDRGLYAVDDPNLPEPPYPAETYVKGWRFELDHERLFSSDTWALAPPDMRPWLLMLWHTAWTQRPAGAFTNDHAVIASKIGMDVRLFQAHADILLRGFVLHSDHRLYHPVVIEQVQNVLVKREGNRSRKANQRARKQESHTSVTRDSRVSHGYVTTPEPVPVPVEETHPTDESATSQAKRHEPCPFEAIRELWIEMMPELRAPIGSAHWTDARKAVLRSRWRDQLPDLDAWRECFELVRKSDFLMGRTASRGRRPFEADLFWIAKPENLLKIYEGKYHA